MLKIGSQFSVLGSQDSVLGAQGSVLSGGRKLLQKFSFEFTGGATQGTAVVGVRHFPQNNSWIVGGDPAAVADGDVAIVGAVDQHYGHLR